MRNFDQKNVLEQSGIKLERREKVIGMAGDAIGVGIGTVGILAGAGVTGVGMTVAGVALPFAALAGMGGHAANTFISHKAGATKEAIENVDNILNELDPETAANQIETFKEIKTNLEASEKVELQKKNYGIRTRKGGVVVTATVASLLALGAAVPPVALTAVLIAGTAMGAVNLTHYAYKTRGSTRRGKFAQQVVMNRLQENRLNNPKISSEKKEVAYTVFELTKTDAHEKLFKRITKNQRKAIEDINNKQKEIMKLKSSKSESPEIKKLEQEITDTINNIKSIYHKTIREEIVKDITGIGKDLDKMSKGQPAEFKEQCYNEYAQVMADTIAQYNAYKQVKKAAGLGKTFKNGNPSKYEILEKWNDITGKVNNSDASKEQKTSAKEVYKAKMLSKFAKVRIKEARKKEKEIKKELRESFKEGTPEEKFLKSIYSDPKNKEKLFGGEEGEIKDPVVNKLTEVKGEKGSLIKALKTLGKEVNNIEDEDIKEFVKDLLCNQRAKSLAEFSAEAVDVFLKETSILFHDEGTPTESSKKGEKWFKKTRAGVASAGKFVEEITIGSVDRVVSGMATGAYEGASLGWSKAGKSPALGALGALGGVVGAVGGLVYGAGKGLAESRLGQVTGGTVAVVGGVVGGVAGSGLIGASEVSSRYRESGMVISGMAGAVGGISGVVGGAVAVAGAAVGAVVGSVVGLKGIKKGVFVGAKPGVILSGSKNLKTILHLGSDKAVGVKGEAATRRNDAAKQRKEFYKEKNKKTDQQLADEFNKIEVTGTIENQNAISTMTPITGVVAKGATKVTCSKAKMRTSGQNKVLQGYKDPSKEPENLGKQHLSNLCQSKIEIEKEDGKVEHVMIRHAILGGVKENKDGIGFKDVYLEFGDQKGINLNINEGDLNETATKFERIAKAVGDEKLANECRQAGKSKKKLKKLQKKLGQKVDAKNKAMDLLRMAVMQEVAENPPKDEDGTINIHLNSISLVTCCPDLNLPKKLPGDETKMYKGQRDALESLEKLTDDEKTELLSTISVNDKPLTDVELDVKTVSFNFAVNEGRGLSEDHDKKVNKEALKKLTNQLENVKDADKTQDPSIKAAIEKLENLIENPGGEDSPYLAPVLAAFLSNAAKGQTAYNCKSGKDRTGMVDAELKFLYARLEKNGGDMNEALKDFEDLAKGDACKKGEKTAYASRIEKLHPTIEQQKKQQAIERGNRLDELKHKEEFKGIFESKTPDKKVVKKFRQKVCDMIRETGLTNREGELQADNLEMILLSGNLEMQELNTGFQGYKLEGGNGEEMFMRMTGLPDVSLIHADSGMTKT